MMHARRRWSFYPVATAEELAAKLTTMTSPLCTGAYSGPNRPLIPFQIGPPFRFIPATYSDSFRPPQTDAGETTTVSPPARILSPRQNEGFELVE